MSNQLSDRRDDEDRVDDRTTAWDNHGSSGTLDQWWGCERVDGVESSTDGVSELDDADRKSVV